VLRATKDTQRPLRYLKSFGTRKKERVKTWVMFDYHGNEGKIGGIYVCDFKGETP
jgi:hypothetical protein